MGLWGFLTVMVCVTSFFGYLKTKNSKGAGGGHVQELEARLSRLEAERAGGGSDETSRRLDVLEDIVFSQEMGLDRQIEQAAREAAAKANVDADAHVEI